MSSLPYKRKAPPAELQSPPIENFLATFLSLVGRSRGLTGVIIALWRTLLNSGKVIKRTFHLLLRN